jgi:hypothetical protein
MLICCWTSNASCRLGPYASNALKPDSHTCMNTYDILVRGSQNIIMAKPQNEVVSKGTEAERTIFSFRITISTSKKTRLKPSTWLKMFFRNCKTKFHIQSRAFSFPLLSRVQHWRYSSAYRYMRHGIGLRLCPFRVNVVMLVTTAHWYLLFELHKWSKAYNRCTSWMGCSSLPVGWGLTVFSN